MSDCFPRFVRRFPPPGCALLIFVAVFGAKAGAASFTTNSTGLARSLVATNVSGATSMDSLDDRHKLGIGDRISYRVLEDRDEPKPILITDSGEIEVPYLGRVSALDKTCKSLSLEIKAVLEKELYHRATVIIGVDALNKNRGKVYVVGQVKNPGAVEIPSDDVFTLSKAIMGTGGFGEFGDKKRVRLTRQVGPKEDDIKTFVVDVSEIWEKGKTDKDLKLQPGDRIFVPAKLVNF